MTHFSDWRRRSLLSLQFFVNLFAGNPFTSVQLVEANLNLLSDVVRDPDCGDGNRWPAGEPSCNLAGRLEVTASHLFVHDSLNSAVKVTFIGRLKRIYVISKNTRKLAPAKFLIGQKRAQRISGALTGTPLRLTGKTPTARSSYRIGVPENGLPQIEARPGVGEKRFPGTSFSSEAMVGVARLDSSAAHTFPATIHRPDSTSRSSKRKRITCPASHTERTFERRPP